MDEAEDANYISAKQNGRHLVDKNQFIYSLLRKRNDKAYYTCINKKKMNCKATAIVTGDKITRKSGTHNHDTDLLKKRVRELEHQAIRAASTNHSAPRTVLGDLTAAVSNVSEGKKKTRWYTFQEKF